MIRPTVGRVVWFYQHSPAEGEEPFAAIIAKVHSDTEVNLMVINDSGSPSPHTRVPLVQGDGHLAVPHCCWMPYQKGQAAKTEQAEAVAVAARKGFHGN